MTKSSQLDSFTRDRLPPPEHWPYIIPLPALEGHEPVNCSAQFLDRHLKQRGRSVALRAHARQWTYDKLAETVFRIARIMRDDFGIVSGNRVLIRGGNSPEVVAIWLAIQRIGAVAVTTMSLLRAGELLPIIKIAKPSMAFCEEELAGELMLAIERSESAISVLSFGAESGALFDRISKTQADCPLFPALPEDISIIAFTSGTTGRPKATIHFHRDMLAVCEVVSRHILSPTPDDIFIGTAPLAFTFGLGGLLAFPLYAGACSVLHARYAPAEFIDAIDNHKATICFTVPTYYQQIMRLEGLERLCSLRIAVSSGEALPLPVRDAWLNKTGLALTEVLGSTEMLHAFAGSRGHATRPGFIGPAISGYEVAVLGDEGQRLAPGETGRLAVRGPTGCRYLDDPRQRDYVRFGWNLTGDACSLSEDGYVAYHTRYDDMIISSGYNISGIEVENALLEHDAVSECAVIGDADDERGMIVCAHVVLKAGIVGDDVMTKALQAHVRNTIAPYKYPRKIVFETSLPRNESGKIQRFRLR